jgi:hypothetical protein
MEKELYLNNQYKTIDYYIKSISNKKKHTNLKTKLI